MALRTIKLCLQASETDGKERGRRKKTLANTYGFVCVLGALWRNCRGGAGSAVGSGSSGATVRRSAGRLD